MNLILLSKEDFIDGSTARLGGRRLKHVLEVHRAKAGDTLSVGLLGDRVGTGTVTHVDGRFLEMQVRLKRKPPQALPLTLLLALPRPKVLRRVLFAAAVLGAKKVFLINCYRVEKSFWKSPVLLDRHMREQLQRGLEQAKDTVLPEVFLRRRFKPFVEDELPGLVAEKEKLVAHPGAAKKCPRGRKGPVCLAIGPEGGFIPYEIDKFIDLGFTAVNLGPRILTVETAVPYLISRLF